MSISIDPPIDDVSSRFRPYVRPIALTLLLVAEVFLLSIRFASPWDLPSGPWWAEVVRNAGGIMRLLLVIPAAVSAFGGFRLAVRFRRAFLRDAELHDSWPSWLLAHLVAMAGLTVMTAVICEGSLASSAHPGVRVAIWIASGLSMGVAWLVTLLAPESWREIVRRSTRPLAMGVTVTVAAFATSRLTSRLWDVLAESTLTLVRTGLGFVARDVICDPARMIVGVGDFKVVIAHGCSGFEGIGLVVAFLGAYLWWFRSSLRWPAAYLLVPTGAAIIWTLNAVRIALLVLIGAWSSPEVAIGGFHSQAGWIAFLGVSLGLVAASRRIPFFAADFDDVAGPARSNPTLAYLGAFLAILATSMVTGAFSAGFDSWYGLRVLTGGLALWAFRREFVGALRDCSWAGVAIGVIAFALWVALEPTSSSSQKMLSDVVWGMSPGRAWAWIALRVIGSVAIVPLAEELAFRGYLARRVISSDFESVPMGRFTWASLLISSTAFGLLHGRWLAGMLVGILYALAATRRGKLGDAVLAHAVTNMLIAVTVLATGDWAMWS